MPKTYRQIGMTANSVTYASASDLTDTVKEIINRTTKKIGKYTLQNVVLDLTLNRRRQLNVNHDPDSGEIIPNDLCCDPPVFEFQKIQLVVSGSIEGKAEMLAYIQELYAIVDVIDDDALSGFITYGGISIP